MLVLLFVTYVLDCLDEKNLVFPTELLAFTMSVVQGSRFLSSTITLTRRPEPTISIVRGSRFRQMMAAQTHMRKARQQIEILDSMLTELRLRAQRSKDQDLQIVTAQINRRISVAEGVRGMYFEYIRRKATEIAVPSRELYDEDVISTLSIDDDDMTFHE